MLADRGDIGRPDKAQSPAERPASLREIETARHGVHVRTTTEKATTRIRNQADACLIRVDTDRHDS